MGYIYLASPYTAGGAGPFLREQRYLQAMEHMAWMLKNGIYVYSPIVHCHDLAKTADLPRDAKFWEKYNFAMLYGAEAMHILMLPGWELSKGIEDEARFAHENHKPVMQVVLCQGAQDS